MTSSLKSSVDVVIIGSTLKKHRAGKKYLSIRMSGPVTVRTTSTWTE